MTLTTIRWGLAAVATVLAQFTLIALSIACVAVYSYGIRTGETPEFYSSFAEASAPWVSLIAGGPGFFLIARSIRHRARSAAGGTAMALCGLYLIIEIAVLLTWPGDSSAVLPFTLGGMALKVAGAWRGAGGIAAREPANTAV
jgi:hypothetical protein